MVFKNTLWHQISRDGKILVLIITRFNTHSRAPFPLEGVGHRKYKLLLEGVGHLKNKMQCRGWGGVKLSFAISLKVF